MTDDPKQERRRQILDAALEAFAEKGFDKTTMDDIARASNVSKGLLYWYFENKQALFAALIKTVFDDFRMMFDQIVRATQEQSPPDRLRALIVEPSKMIIPDTRFVGLYMDFFVQAWQYDLVQQAIKAVYPEYVELIADAIHDGIEQGDFQPVNSLTGAQAIVGSIDGMMFQLLVDGGIDIQLPLELLADLIVRGLAKGENDHA
jgi:TetR/AcrR family fatty acid metabolism transcriptional regulator